jgi:hypothetical protein
MFSSSYVYKLFKPESNPDLITSYEVVVGGTILPAKLKSGVILVTPLFSKAVTSQYNDLQSLEYNAETDTYSIKQSSYIESTYQIDIYKINDKNAQVIQAEVEAYKLREWLKSYEVSEYLANLKADILPIYDNIRFSSELLNKELVNRASFEMKIISKVEISENTAVADKATIKDINILTGGLNG